MGKVTRKKELPYLPFEIVKTNEQILKEQENNPNKGAIGGRGRLTETRDLSKLPKKILESYNGNVPNEITDEDIYNRQSKLDVLGNSFGQAGFNFIGGILDGIGANDLEDVKDLAFNTNKKYGNAFHSLASSIQEKGREMFPIYEKHPGSVNFTSGAYWGNQFASLAYSGGLATEMMGETAALEYFTAGFGTEAALANAVNKGSKIAKLLQIAKEAKVGTALYGGFQGIKEAGLNGVMTWEDVYKDFKNKKYTDEEAQKYASIAAHDGFIKEVGTSMLLNGLQNRSLAFTSPKYMKGISKSTLYKLGGNMLSEGFEEGWQTYASMEGKYTANALAGETGYKNPMERFKEFMSSDEMINSIVGGVLGGTVFQGIGTVKNDYLNRNYNKAINTAHKDFLDKSKSYVLEGSNMIQKMNNDADKLHSEGKIEEANNLYKQAEMHKRNHNKQMALNAIHLDDLADNDSDAFDNYVTNLKDILENVDNVEKDENGNDKPTQFNSDYVKSVFPKMIEDANKIKEIYEQVKKKGNSANDTFQLSQLHYNLFEFNKQKTNKLNELNALQYTENLNNLSDKGKEIYQLNAKMASLQNQAERLDEMKNSEEKQNSHFYDSLIEKNKKDIEANEKRMEEINADESYDKTTKDKDALHLSTILGDTEYLKLNDNLKELDDLIELTSNKIAKFKDIKEEERRIKKQLKANKENKGFLQKLKENYLNRKNKKQNNTQLEKKIDDAIEVATVIENKKNPVPVNPEKIEAEKNLGNNLLNNLTSNVVDTSIDTKGQILGTLGDNGYIVPNKDNTATVDESNPFEPNQVNENTTPEQNEALKQSISDLYEYLKDELNRNPNFEEFVKKFIEINDKKTAEKYYNALIKGWKLNDYQEYNYQAIYNSIFKDIKSINNNLVNALDNSITLENQKAEETDTNTLIVEQDKANNNIATMNIVRNSTLGSTETNNKMAYSIMKKKLVIEQDDKGTKFAYIEVIKDIKEENYINPLLLLDPEKYQPGTKLEIKVATHLFDKPIIKVYDKNGIIEKDEKGNNKYISFNEYVISNKLSPEMQAYKDKVPMIIHDGTNDLSYVHETDWYNKLNVADDVTRDAALKNLRNVRENVLNNNNKIVVTNKRNSSFEDLVINDKSIPVDQLPSIMDAFPNSIIGVSSSNGLIKINSGKEGDIFFNGILRNKETIEKNKPYDIRLHSYEMIDGKLTPIYIALNVMKDNKGIQNNEEVKESILGAINIFLTEPKELTSEQLEIIKTIKETNGFDITDSFYLNKYISQFIAMPIVSEKNVDNVPNSLSNNYGTYLVSEGSKHSIDVDGKKEKVIIFGDKQNKLSPDDTTGYMIAHKKMSNQQKQDFLDLVEERLFNGKSQNIDSAANGQNKAVIGIVDGKAVELSKSYQDMIKTNIKTIYPAINIGTKENPNMVMSTHNHITYDLVSNSITPKVTEGKVIEKPIVKVENKVENTENQSDIDAILNNIKSELDWMDDELLEPDVNNIVESMINNKEATKICG